jgi:hypothetical protein
MVPPLSAELTLQSSPTRKRVRDQTGHVPTSDPVPPSSPPLRDEDMAEEADAFDDEIEDAVQDLDDMDEEMDGEDLFNDTMMRYPHTRL